MHVDRERDHRHENRGKRHAVERQGVEAVTRQDQTGCANNAGHADAGGEELEDEQRKADDEQQVRNRWATDRVHELVDQTELEEAHQCGVVLSAALIGE